MITNRCVEYIQHFKLIFIQSVLTLLGHSNFDTFLPATETARVTCSCCDVTLSLVFTGVRLRLVHCTAVELL